MKDRKGNPDLKKREIMQIWEDATNGAVLDPFHVADTRGSIVNPAADRRLTPHDRVRKVMEQEDTDYKTALRYVIDVMVFQGELPEDIYEQSEVEEQS